MCRREAERGGSGSVVELIGAFESTFLPAYDVDVAETTGHADRWRDDLRLVASLGVRRLRLPVRWHRVERQQGVYDFGEVDQVIGHARALGMSPILDLVHHTSYPRWLDDGFADRRFGEAYLRWCEQVAQRYPWMREYTLFNEPFATLFLAGHEALWPPYHQGMSGFLDLLRNVLPPLVQASRMYAELLPDASHVWVDTCEDHQGTPGAPAAHAELCNDRRTIVLDLFLGHRLDVDARPFLRSLVHHGGQDLLERLDTLGAGRVDVVGLDYYPHSEWWYDDVGGHAPSPQPRGFAALSRFYSDRYERPLLLAETNIRGFPSDRATWLRLMLEQYEIAVADGVDLRGFCWFPSIDSADWDSLLARPAGRLDPVGLVSLRADGTRLRTSATASAVAMAGGSSSAELPAYRLQLPASDLLAAHVARAGPCTWLEPPDDDRPPAPRHTGAATRRRAEDLDLTDRDTDSADLVVLSHLRWSWVWQRPQHLMSRLARVRAAAGGRTFFVEEPACSSSLDAPRLRRERHDNVERIWLEIPGPDGFLSFDAPGTDMYADLLAAAVGNGTRDVWLYSPMALDMAAALQPRVLIYDVMDDLAAFALAPPGLILRQRRALMEADVVFTGGRSLHRGVAAVRAENVHLFPSGVEVAHWRTARTLRQQRPPKATKVVGYVGVIDERLDLRLIGDLAAALPDWRVEIVGPVAKIDPASLPQGENLTYRGHVPYSELPAVLAGFDVALMPFALNEATRSISPTKTLEYLAAGLPVVSTRVADVVADHAAVVHLVDTSEEAAAACRRVIGQSQAKRDRLAAPLQARQEWDTIARQMGELVAAAVHRRGSPVGADVVLGETG